MVKNNVMKLVLITALVISMIGIGSAIAYPPLNDGVCEPDVWIYADPGYLQPDNDADIAINSLVGSYWRGYDGRLALLHLNGNSQMEVSIAEPTACLYVQFASDRNDGMASIYVDGELIWEGNTWAPNALGKPLDMQQMRYLKVTGLEPTAHTIKILTGEQGHVTIYQFGYDRCTSEEIPEFPTVALPIVAIIGLTFIFQRRKEE
ncbi:PEF-CTERM sorting domain-containing protein [Methanococcoides burtonii]|uniref:PEF-CTERM sorting domain-containing protein n=1 Tax=Methanococcoides burtonii TaxID=29291 RepID=UPI00064FE0BE|nr:PEF-CTERM sorting domain-containing protein [Methanococcoides burtonii]